jgi:hypothetical protein
MFGTVPVIAFTQIRSQPNHHKRVNFDARRPADQQDPERRIAEVERQVEEAKPAASRPPSPNARGSPVDS